MPSQQLIFSDVLTKNEEFNMTVDMQTSLVIRLMRYQYNILYEFIDLRITKGF